MKEKSFTFKKGFRSHSPKKLTFTEKSLKYEDTGYVTDLKKKFKKDDITDFRYGVRWIQFEVTYGREYQIFIRNKKNEVLKITFKSYLGRKRKALWDLYNQIINALWGFYFADIAQEFVNKHYNGQTFSINDIHFNSDGIVLPVSGILSQKKVAIPWEHVRTRNYHHYFSVYSNENPVEVNRGFYYHEDWNTAVIFGVLKAILKDKGIEQHS